MGVGMVDSLDDSLVASGPTQYGRNATPTFHVWVVQAQDGAVAAAYKNGIPAMSEYPNRPDLSRWSLQLDPVGARLQAGDAAQVYVIARGPDGITTDAWTNDVTVTRAGAQSP